MENLAIKFIYFQEQFRVLHWHTTSYARHMAFGGFYGTLTDLIDDFIESYQGKYGREFFGKESIELTDGKEIDLNGLIKEMIDFLQEEIPSMLDKEKDTDLLNIRDSILGELNKLKYLLSLK